MSAAQFALASGMGTAGAAWVAEQMAEGIGPRTITDRIAIVRRAAAATDHHPERFTREALVEYLGSPHFSASTRVTYSGALRAWCAWLVESGHRDDDPMARMRKPKSPKRTPHPITTDELHRILDTRMWPSTRASVMLAAYAGLRVHEIAKFRGEDVAGEQFCVAGKGGRVDWLPLHPRLQELAQRMPRSGWWFPSPADASRPVDASSMSAGIARLMRRAGVNGTAHSLRHWFATELVRAGVDLRTVQELMRHSSLATTAIYTAVDDRQRREGLSRLPAA